MSSLNENGYKSLPPLFACMAPFVKATYTASVVLVYSHPLRYSGESLRLPVSAAKSIIFLLPPVKDCARIPPAMSCIQHNCIWHNLSPFTTFYIKVCRQGCLVPSFYSRTPLILLSWKRYFRYIKQRIRNLVCGHDIVYCPRIISWIYQYNFFIMRNQKKDTKLLAKESLSAAMSFRSQRSRLNINDRRVPSRKTAYLSFVFSLDTSYRGSFSSAHLHN